MTNPTYQPPSFLIAAWARANAQSKQVHLDENARKQVYCAAMSTSNDPSKLIRPMSDYLPPYIFSSFRIWGRWYVHPTTTSYVSWIWERKCFFNIIYVPERKASDPEFETELREAHARKDLLIKKAILIGTPIMTVVALFALNYFLNKQA